MKKSFIAVLIAAVLLSGIFFIAPCIFDSLPHEGDATQKSTLNPDSGNLPEETASFSVNETATPVSISGCDDCCCLVESGDKYYGVMAINDEYKEEKKETISANPIVSYAAENPFIDETVLAGDIPDYSGNGKYLNGYIPYFGSEKDQGLCGNCWVWTCTEIAEIEYAVMTGNKERLSVQYFNSNYKDGQGSGDSASWACCGGNLFHFTEFYNQNDQEKLIPWDNTKAGYYDRMIKCSDGASNMQSALISADPYIPFDSMAPYTVQTWGVSQSKAIDTIESYIDEGKALYVSFEWVSGEGFDQWWSSGYGESVYDPIAYVGSGTPDSAHAVTLIGYNESAWLLHNSWGTSSNHPDGTFWMTKDFDYSAGSLLFPSDTYVNFYGFEITGLTEAAPDIIREYAYGGANADMAYSIVRASDGGYVLAGKKSSNNGKYPVNYGSSDIWIVKTNSSGSIEWERVYGGSGEDSAYGLIKTSDDGFLIAGSTSSSDINISGNRGGSDALLLKTDSNGLLQWLKVYGGSGDESFNDIETVSGGYIAAGETRSSDGDVSFNNGGKDAWIVKFDRSGNLIWENAYGGSADESFSDIVLPGDGTLLASGSTMSSDGNISSNNGGKDAWIIKADLAGNLFWENTYGGSSDEQAMGIGVFSDGSYVAVGSAESSDGDVFSNSGGEDVWLFGINSTGGLEWGKNYGGTGDDEAASVLVLEDDYVLITAATGSFDGDVPGNNGDTDAWLLKTDSSGNIIWTGCYGGQKKDLIYEIVSSDLDDVFFGGGCTFSSDGDVSSNNGGGDLWIAKFGYTEEDPTPDPTVTPTPRLNATPTPTEVYTKVSGEPSSTSVDLQAVIQAMSESDYAGNTDVKGTEPGPDQQSGYPSYINAQKVIGGTGDDFATSVIPVSSGFIVAGVVGGDEGSLKSGNGGADILLAGFDSGLDLVWQKYIGGSGDDTAVSVVKSGDDSLFVAGTTSSSDGNTLLLHGGTDFLIACTDEKGEIRWIKSFGGSLDDRASSMTMTADGDFIVVGETWSSDGDISFENKKNLGKGDLWVVRFDSSGNLTWERRLGGTGYDRASAVAPVPDGGCTIAGETWSIDGDPSGNNNKHYGESDIWVLRLDRDGRVIWQKTFGTSGEDGATGIELSNDGGYIISGYATDGDDDAEGSYRGSDAWILKIDSSGKLLWKRSYGSMSSDLGMAADCCSNGDFIIAGVSFSESDNMSVGGNYDGWLIKLDPSGTVLWEKSFGDSGEDWVYDIACYGDENEYILAGMTVGPDDQQGSFDSDLLLVKIDGELGYH